MSGIEAARAERDTRDRASSTRSGLRVQLLAAREHRDERLDAPGARLRLLAVADPVEHRVAVGAVERREEGGRRRARVERLAAGRRGPRSCGRPRTRDPSARRPSPARSPRVPPAVISSGPSSSSALSRLIRDHRLRAAARREPLQPEALVERALLPVDPAMAETELDRLGVGHRRHACILLGELQPDARRRCPRAPSATRQGRRGSRSAARGDRPPCTGRYAGAMVTTARPRV